MTNVLTLEAIKKEIDLFWNLQNADECATEHCIFRAGHDDACELDAIL